jgi:hypothetical protein
MLYLESGKQCTHLYKGSLMIFKSFYSIVFVSCTVGNDLVLFTIECNGTTRYTVYCLLSRVANTAILKVKL